MRFLQVACMCLLAITARTQELQNCTVDATPTIGSTEDVGNLATLLLACSAGHLAVQWVGQVFVEETIYVTGGTSLNVTGAGPGATADGGGSTQLFVVDGGSSLHLSGMTLSNGNGSYGGAIFANQSSVVSFSGSMSFVSNSAKSGGAIAVVSSSSLSWDGDNTEFISNYAEETEGDAGGGAIFALDSVVSWDGDGTLFRNNFAGAEGGAIYAIDSTVSWDGDGTEFSNNSAIGNGGALFVLSSADEIWTVSWNGDNTRFISNSADVGGAVHAVIANVSWNGDGTEFVSNSADWAGGAIHAFGSAVHWNGDNTEFVSNSVGPGRETGGGGGAIGAIASSSVSWSGDRTKFSNNSDSTGDGGGGALYLWDSTVSWDGDTTQFSSNYAVMTDGGAISASGATVAWNGHRTKFSNNSAASVGGALSAYDSTVTWDGVGTEFISNFARTDGGAIHLAASTTVSFDQNTSFTSNVAEENGGALFVVDLEENMLLEGGSDGMEFLDNVAGFSGGAVQLSNCAAEIVFRNVTFQSNSASVEGGAVAVITSDSAEFSRCSFVDNKTNGTGGAVEALAGRQLFDSCDFVGNSADVGGAMRLGGTADVTDCSFLSNLATSRGLALAVVAYANITGSSFDRNEFYCEAGSYRADTQEEEVTAARFETVCFDCPDWSKCFGCAMERGDVTPTCEVPLAHASASAPGLTMETLSVDRGYWRAANDSDNILACYNAEACSGGVTGTGGYCASGYTGPYCAVCEAGFSASPGRSCARCSSTRRQGMMAATAIAALVALVAVAVVIKFLLSTKVEEENIGWFHRRVLRAVPIQALKIVVVVWQILTQFADAANQTYPRVYQDFLNVVDVVSFDLGSVLAAGCLWSEVDFHDRLIVSTVGPLVAIGFLAITYGIAVRRNGASSGTAVAEKVFHKHLTALLLLTFLVYSSVSSMVFQTFACETLDDGIEYLRADYSILCTDSKHKAFEVYAGIMVFVYPVGIPLLYAVLLFQRREVLGHAGADKTIALSIGGLWEQYTPQRFYYEVVECGRRIMLTGVVVFIFPNDAAQVAITLLIALFFLVVFEVMSPYKSESDMWLSRGGHLIVFLSMFDLLLLKVDVSGERDQSQAAFAGVLVAGHVLMILAIVVEAVGIFYASRKNKAAEVGETPSGSPSGLRSRVESDDVPVFQSAPSSWRSFVFRKSVSESTRPSRGVSGTELMTVGRP